MNVVQGALSLFFYLECRFPRLHTRNRRRRSPER